MSALGLGQTDPVLRFAVMLVQLGICAAGAIVWIWLVRVAGRAWLLSRVTRQFPEQASEIRAAARTVPLLRRAAPAPADIFARTYRVVVVPLGDGRPGELFLAPGPARTRGALGPDGSRTDVIVKLADGVDMLVVCFGRIGSRSGDIEVRPAAERAESARAACVAPRVAVGPAFAVLTAAGTGWRTTSCWGSSRSLTDTHIDRDGWAFVIGVLSVAGHSRAVGALDGILQTWQWLPDEGGPRES
jgi:hypothetical protein